MTQPDPKEQKPRRAHWTVASVALVVIGLLVLLPSSMCVGAGVIGMALALVSGVGQASNYLLLMIIGAAIAAGAISTIVSGFKSRKVD